jgi:hypothetical protein
VRAALSRPGTRGATFGWMTLIMKDGAENASYLPKQPPPELPPDGICRAAPEPVAMAQKTGGAFFVF